ncbi:MAG: hypothetical protein IKS56_00955 [Lachnospiraceae bacterium]|nr:hypothetical protein [Lachnospiraceae bacterium]
MALEVTRIKSGKENLMKRENRQVCYSYEHGDKSLPHLKDLVSDTPDSMKSKIMAYLKTNMIVFSPGIIKDEINPDNTIGCGNSYSDGTYIWDDVFYEYVDQYNIPVPEEFRNHILENFEPRMKRHALLHVIDRVEIHNNPYLGYMFDVSVKKTGMIQYHNNTDCKDGAVIFLKPEDGAYIINPIMTELFCYDSDNHGRTIIDGHCWNIKFYRKDELIERIEGHTGEDVWRFNEFKRVLKFIEREISNDLGTNYMETFVP